MIELRDVQFQYRDGTQALKDVSVTFPEKEIFAVLGQSGSGKTTLLNCIGRFLQPQSGTICLDGQDIFDMTEKAFRRRVGVVFQKLFLFPHMTVFENMILAPKKVQGLTGRQVKHRAYEILERLGIMDLSESYPAQVSGGQAQRAAIARGLMLRPDYLLLDEPTSALDAETTADFAHWLRELHEATNFIIVTHDIPFARQASRRGIYMRQGEVCYCGRLDEILTSLRDERPGRP